MRWIERLTAASYDHPRTILALAALVTALFAFALPHVRIDTDPENMLESRQADRVLYNEIKRDFGLHDLVVVGIVDERGVYRVEALERVARIADGIARVPGVITEDLVSLRTSSNATSSGGVVDIYPVMEEVPRTPDDVARVRREVVENSFLQGKLVSEDGKATAIYVPVVSKDQSRRITEEIRTILERELLPGQSAHVAGLPVAEDTFGHEMFVQMAVVAPLAFLGILLLVYLLFRDFSFLLPVALTAALSVIWTMGALVASGQTVHIMSSMIPVFLMPIAVLDAVHILSEFHERRREIGEPRRALREGMRPLHRPMLITTLTTAAGFASLALSRIPPVQVFGLFVALGIAAAWLLSHTLVPALFALSSRSGKVARAGEPAGKPAAAVDGAVRFLGSAGYRWARPVLLGTGVLVLVGGIGLTRLHVDDNPVRWFRPGHPLREADEVMNRSFGGTYMAMLLVEGATPGAIHRPEVVRYIERLQERLEQQAVVGKTSSVADIVRRLNLVLHEGDRAYDVVPADEESVAQLLFVFQGSAQPGELDNFMDQEARRANVWVQMRAGENSHMRRVEDALASFMAAQPPPEPLRIRWSGPNHINMVWQGLMVKGMIQALLGSFMLVFLLMSLEFRSFTIGLLAMIPLSVAIVVAYGILALFGRPLDMPMAVCSSLSLGLADDFSIHFFDRFRERGSMGPTSADASAGFLSGVPGRAIAQNAIVISVGFLPLVFSSLTPYLTVALFFAGLMTACAVATLLLLPAAMRVSGAGAFRPRAAAAVLLAVALAGGAAGEAWAAGRSNAAAPAKRSDGAAPGAPADGRAVMERSNRAYYYAGDDFRAKLTMELGTGSRTDRQRVLSQLRMNVGPGGEQKYMLYFHKPGDVRRMSCMIFKHVGHNDERWMFVPLTRRVVKVRALDRSSFLGSEVMREELSGRDVDGDRHRLLRRERLDGRDCYVVESVPRGKADFARYVSWIDGQTYLPLKQEYYDVRGELYRVFTGAKIEAVASARKPGHRYPTLMERTIRAHPSGRWTRVVLDSVFYDIGLRESDFKASRLNVPIDDWLAPSRDASLGTQRAGVR